MARGTKIDLSLGATFDEGWQQVDDAMTEVAMEQHKPHEHRLVFKKEKRRGKPVTLVGPFSLPKEEVQSLLKGLKKKLGCGGTFKENWMEFQGDIAPKLRPLLVDAGFGVKSPS